MGVSYISLIDRMRKAAKLKNDSAIARTLGITPQALSNYKKRGEIPADLVLKFADMFGLSVDWLLTGEGEMYKSNLASSKTGGAAYAAEEAGSYGKTTAEGLAKITECAALTPDEIIYVGKLLKILRGYNKSAVAAIKYSIDTFSKASESAEEEIKKEGAR
ncbi:MAG TPA: helix-turn-helix domain-containing protein [Deltaproteobacteria bacterium]|nr:helix-turn-helix domain-containing protein [Deltaproteobacteria bacterium]